MGVLVTRAILSVVTLWAVSATYADEYREPKDLNGYRWGAELSEFVSDSEVATIAEAVELQRPTKLELVTVESVRGARGVATSLDVACKQEGPTGECLRPELTQTIAGDGSHVLARYARIVDRNPFPGAYAFMTQYFFCASAKGSRSPESLAPFLEFCGALVVFQDETDEQLAESDHRERNAERILNILIERHGKPQSYLPRGRVQILQDGKEVESQRTDARRYHRHRWCGKREGQLYPPCTVSVIMTFDPANGWGSVLYAMRGVYAFAQAKHDMGDPHYWLYVLLSDNRKLYFNPRKARQVCTGSLLCRPTGRELSVQEVEAFQPRNMPRTEERR